MVITHSKTVETRHQAAERRDWKVCLVKSLFNCGLTYNMRRRIAERMVRLLPALLIGLASPAWAGAVGATAEGQKLVYRDDGQTVVIQAWGRDGLRVRVTPAGGGQTSDWALDIPLETQGEIELSDTVATIRNGKISARIQDIATQRGRLQFFRHRGDEAVCILSEYDYVVHAHNPGTRTFRPVGDGLFHCELHLAARDGERFYGMGENATGRLNLKGAVIDLYQRHVKAVVPFVVSSEGYGFLWNNPALGRVEFGANRTRWVSYGSKQLDCMPSSPSPIRRTSTRGCWRPAKTRS